MPWPGPGLFTGSAETIAKLREAIESSGARIRLRRRSGHFPRRPRQRGRDRAADRLDRGDGVLSQVKLRFETKEGGPAPSLDETRLDSPLWPDASFNSDAAELPILDRL